MVDYDGEYEIDGLKFRGAEEIARHFNRRIETVRMRIRTNTLRKFLSRPPFEVNGKKFYTLKSCSEYYGRGADTISRYRRKGVLELLEDGVNYKCRVVLWRGVRFSSIREASVELCVPYMRMYSAYVRYDVDSIVPGVRSKYYVASDHSYYENRYCFRGHYFRTQEEAASQLDVKRSAICYHHRHYGNLDRIKLGRCSKISRLTKIPEIEKVV